MLVKRIRMSANGCINDETWKDMETKNNEIINKLKTTESYITYENTCNHTYEIHDNGGVPYHVKVSRNNIQVYTSKYYNNDSYELDNMTPDKFAKSYTKLVTSFTNFDGYWSGYDSSAHQEHGNSILVKLSKSKYVHISSDISSFEIDDDKIIDFISCMGNNDVPYPVAYGREYVYFLGGDGRRVQRSNISLEITVENADDMYEEFYGHINSINGEKMKDDVIEGIPKCEILFERM